MKHDLVSEIQTRCADANVSPVAFLNGLGVHRATWFRWKSGQFGPRYSTVIAIREALEKLERAA